MKKLIISALLFITIFSLMLSGCNSEVKTYTDAGQVINSDVGQTFNIALGSNPTTGYSWQTSYDNTILELVSKEYKADDKSGKQLVGSGGTEYFTFKVLTNGETKVTLTYRRPWENPNPQDTTQVFTVNAK